MHSLWGRAVPRLTLAMGSQSRKRRSKLPGIYRHTYKHGSVISLVVLRFERDEIMFSFKGYGSTAELVVCWCEGQSYAAGAHSQRPKNRLSSSARSLTIFTRIRSLLPQLSASAFLSRFRRTGIMPCKMMDSI